jgi:hypothetical protein
MPFTSYSALVATVSDWLARDDLNAQVRDFIWLAECDVQRTVKFRLADKIEYATSIDKQSYIDLPADYAEGGFLNWIGDTTMPSIEVASYDVTAMHQKSPSFTSRSSGDTSVGTLHGEKLHIGQSPGAVPYEFFYKSGVQHLSERVPTNTLLREYPDCLLFGALVVATPYLGSDERIETWNGFYTNAKEETRMQEWRARSGHGALRMRPDVWPIR